MSDGSSNIRVFINWSDQTVFAGEQVRCTITFRNVAAGTNQQQGNQNHGPQPQSERQRFASPLAVRNKPSSGLTPPLSAALGRGHRRAAQSLSVSHSSSHSRPGSMQWPQPIATGDGRPGHAHKRSVSIISIGSTSTVDDHLQRGDHSPRPHRPRHGHNRASSLQIVSRGLPPAPATQTASYSQRQANSPLFNGSYPPDRFGRMTGPPNAPHPSNIAAQRRSPRMSPNTMPEFRFPAAPPPDSEIPQSPQRASNNGLLSPRPGPNDSNIPIRAKEQASPVNDRPALTARILASTSMAGGTPRSSGEFYSVSNHSSETLASEYVTQPLVRGHARPSHLRRSSGMSVHQIKTPESLMMGYAQIQGSFSLDGSLVSLAPFEQVKKKAVVGGRGGGVVGLESGRRESGLLRSFGWGSISNSLGDFLGGGELSTIKEMRGVVNSKAVPLLTTPQSILFVDLQLAPGESREFEYSFRLPKGLPPTHKGKAVKISYSLVIGTQRAGGAKEQQIRTVEIPFRVLGSVNSYGEILGHDLMNPYILLRDEAQVKALGMKGQRERAPSRSPAAMDDFLNYVDELIVRSKDEVGGGLLSPTAATNSRRPSINFDETTSAKEAIHLAIMRSNLAGEGQQSPNRFEIARNGQRVGVVMLTRPAYRLGEVVTMVIDFTDADIPCYAVHATLETSEKVDSSLAIRSESSIHRVTRKVYVSSSEATLYTRRVVFTPTIPISATPEFVTSGIGFEWKIRVEFVVPSQGSEHTGEQRPFPLLEQISRDEKGGLVLVAVENLACESFEVPVPLRVYGAVGTGLERLERDEASEEGLAI